MTPRDIGNAPPKEIAVGTHFHAWRDTKTTPVFSSADREAMLGLLIISWHSATIKYLFLYP